MSNPQSELEKNHHASDADLDLIFREAHTFTAWQQKDVDVETLKEAYDLMKMGPTSANTCPARFVFLKSEEAKARLLPALAPTNVEKSRTAPVVAIIAFDIEF